MNLPKRLFVYGTLAPGRPNQHILQDVPGEWIPATTRGRLYREGWGAAQGYPGMIPDANGERIEGLIFASDELDRHWPRLDDFEGPGYRRVTIDATLADGSTLDAQIYALNREPDAE